MIQVSIQHDNRCGRWMVAVTGSQGRLFDSHLLNQWLTGVPTRLDNIFAPEERRQALVALGKVTDLGLATRAALVRCLGDLFDCKVTVLPPILPSGELGRVQECRRPLAADIQSTYVRTFPTRLVRCEGWD